MKLVVTGRGQDFAPFLASDIQPVILFPTAGWRLYGGLFSASPTVSTHKRLSSSGRKVQAESQYQCCLERLRNSGLLNVS